MRVYTAHTRDGAAPVLVREGFSVPALILGPVWLLAHRAWIAGVLALCVYGSIALLAGSLAPALLAVSAWVIGLTGRDLRRWSLERAGFHEVHVVTATDQDSALHRLLTRRPDLIADAVR